MKLKAKIQKLMRRLLLSSLASKISVITSLMTDGLLLARISRSLVAMTTNLVFPQELMNPRHIFLSLQHW